MRSRRINVTFALVVAVFVLSGWQAVAGQEAAKQPPRPAGYLSSQELPDSLGLIPALPAPGSATFALDEQVSRKMLTLKGTPAWDLATADADLTFPQVVNAFTCALGTVISRKKRRGSIGSFGGVTWMPLTQPLQPRTSMPDPALSR